MTYSIVARDPTTGALGVAVQSHYFSTGGIVPWAAPGVGAVATQSMAEVSYGPLGLALLAAGRSPEETLRALTAADAGAASRQVAIVDGAGRVAVHTGEACIAEASHRVGAGFSVQSNMMERTTVPDAMAAAFESADGPLPERLLAALDAAEAEGGDIRGRQSAAMVVVPGDRAAPPWTRLVDLRVEDAADPLAELRRLLAMRRAYETMTPGPAMGDNPELAFWRGVMLGAVGQEDEAREWLGQAYAVDARWRELLRRLPAAGRFPDDPDLVARLT